MRRCWAYSPDIQRCAQPAGHDGKHSISTEWDDADCHKFSPDIRTPEPVYPTPPEPATAVTENSCVACTHKHKNFPCKCGCYEFIG